ncbi:HpcH/HpaI aldolase/citrate lyase family protein [Cellulomonas xylanilytica]|uniref:Citrate lyase subunit beta-like protein n=1 Tax=Cellulomonas xylanilytica TaxID=233583 RepID=A0A510V8T2_9CELL|nr:CoA ester lyase [Cellulomonas xylanilytica]GEK23277.1 citrate lyase subunit beta-like protein [Cellulomonas xylanilytica]
MRGPALLFCPADRPERYEKAAARADTVILDLEDAVNPDAKAAARSHLAASALDPARTIVRVNPVGTADLDEDLVALRRTPYRTVMLAKTASAADVRVLARYDVVALVETAAGVVHAAEIAAQPNVVGLMWGAEDLVASLGGTSSRRADASYRDVAVHARSVVLVAAGAYGKDAVDAVHLDIGDVDGLAAEASDAAASGFAATACIHPSQVEVVRAAYRPTDAEVAWARGVLAAAAGQHGAFRWDGKLVDGPVLKHARSVLVRATA